MDSYSASHVGPMQFEKDMLEVEISLFCFDSGRQMMSVLRRWEIGATLSKNILHMGHATSNEMMANALRPRILFNFVLCCPIIHYEQIQNVSFQLQIVVQLELFS